MLRFMSFAGVFVFVLLAWLLSEDRRRFNWRIAVLGIVSQLLFALLILKTAPGEWFFDLVNRVFGRMMKFTDAGAEFLFGGLLKEWSFALKILPTIVFFSSFFTVLYYFGILQRIVKGFAVVFRRLFGTSGAESLSAAANIFIGQTEAPLMVRPYVEKMTRSELMCVMTGGMATIAGGVMAAYVGMGMSAGHLMAASVMSAPAAIMFAKIMVPETGTPVTASVGAIDVPVTDRNAIEAAARGAAEGLYLALNVGAMLLAFIAFVAFFNYFFGFFGVTMEQVLGWVMAPLAFCMGVPWDEAVRVGALLGEKTILNEFVAYAHLSEAIKAGGLSDRSIVIATYALCGFANLGSIAIQIGGIGTMAPSRRGEIAALGIKAMIAGTFASFVTANIAGMLL